MSNEPVLLIGARGLLGTAVRKRLGRDRRAFMAPRIPWNDDGGCSGALRAAVDDLILDAAGGAWSIVWCAGAGVTATPRAHLESELRTLEGVVDHVGGLGWDVLRRGAFFYASSAGGVYAGADAPPFTEYTDTRPLAAYGEFKLLAEGAVGALSTSGVRVLVGRLSNLYGPGQNLAKPQGLISQICLTELTGQPIPIYVSLDTIRDYLFVSDAADMIVDALDRLHSAELGARAVKILASQRSASIAEVLGEFRRVFKRRPRVVVAASPHARQQARDLRFRSAVWPEIDRRSLTPLGAGIQATAFDLERAMQTAGVYRVQ